jgi:UrcA family protein
MRQMRLIAATVLTSCAFIGGALAQTSPEVVVTGSRTTEETTQKPPGGVLPISKVSLSYTVSAQGLDLTSPDGKAKLEKSVSDAAAKVCSDLKRQYPLSKTSEQECVRQAKADAMLKARELEAAAGKGAVK